MIKRTSVLLNADVSLFEAAELISARQIDVASLGWLWISHPDVVNRLRRGVPLDTAVDVTRLYGGGSGLSGELSVEGMKAGYTDYPFAEGGVDVKL